MRVRTRTKHTPIQKTEDVSGVNVLVLFFATIFIVSSVIMLFLNYGWPFAYIMILLTLFISWLMSFYAKKVSVWWSIRQRFFFGAFSILAFVLYFSVAFRSFSFLMFLIFWSLAVILFYLWYKLITFLFKTPLKYDRHGRTECMEYAGDKNFQNHHKYYQNTKLREQYDDTIIKNEIREHILTYLTIFWFMCIFFFFSIQEWQFYIVLSILFSIWMGFSIIKKLLVNRFKAKKEDYNIYTRRLWRVKYYYKSWKNIFFY